MGLLELLRARRSIRRRLREARRKPVIVRHQQLPSEDAQRAQRTVAEQSVRVDHVLEEWRRTERLIRRRGAAHGRD